MLSEPFAGMLTTPENVAVSSSLIGADDGVGADQASGAASLGVKGATVAIGREERAGRIVVAGHPELLGVMFDAAARGGEVVRDHHADAQACRRFGSGLERRNGGQREVEAQGHDGVCEPIRTRDEVKSWTKQVVMGMVAR